MKSDALVVGLDNVYKSVDDFLFQAESIDDLEVLLRKFFNNCRDENVQLSEKKFKASLQLVFGGTLIDTSEGEILFRPEER